MAVNGINPNAVVNAYSNTQGISGGIGGAVGNVGGFAQNDPVQSAGQTGAPSFSDFLTDSAEKSIDTMKSGESMAGKAVAGEADLTDVVQAITSAELTLQTVTAVRDKVINAYQDIMRMPI
ncbi:MAG: flagellar hook-basal body complex protein FliE [Alphaproteobacteria bacterium]